jgi:hypothetical protein
VTHSRDTTFAGDPVTHPMDGGRNLPPRSPVRRRIILATCLVLVAGLSVFATWAIRATPHVRDRVVDALNERFASQVDLDSLDVSIFPRPRVAGTGLELRHNGRIDVPPLITVGSFEASAGVMGLVRTPLHLGTIRLEGLDIQIPPGGLNPGADKDDDVHVPHADRPSPILIDKIESRASRLQIVSRKPGRLPRIFEIHDLVMRDFGKAEGARFEAGLTNPKPRGRVETSGLFGPWHADEPGLTPLSGDYVFKDADLNDIKGISGILSSIGAYRGVLERIEVEGQTETPDFSIDLAGQKVPLRTTFKAIVDGTNGDTYLESVEAKLNESTILASGSVVRTEDVKGRHISLDIKLAGARLEDLMQLAVKAAKPALTGRIDLTTKFLLPAGEGDVIERLQLDGRFQLAQARFTNLNVQKRITTLSRRGRGEENDEGAEGERVVSNLRGRFSLKDARLTFSELTFAVPGSTVALSGSYDLRGGTINFVGDLLTDASLADMTSGWKSMLARVAQPFFRRPGGGSRLPIKISGPREKPQFGLDMSRVFRG